MTASKNRLTFSKQKHIEFWVRIVYFGNPGRIQGATKNKNIIWTENVNIFKKIMKRFECQPGETKPKKYKHWYKTLKVKLFIKWIQEKYFYCRKEINRRQFQSYCIEFNYASESDSPVFFFFTEYGNIQGWVKKGPIQILYHMLLRWILVEILLLLLLIQIGI